MHTRRLAAPLRLSVIIPATDHPATLSRCLDAIKTAENPPDEVIVVSEPARQHVSLARNAGAHQATGDLLVFIDSDVLVHADVFTRIQRAFAEDEALAAVFGSYDDAPAAADTVSQFRNLLHHHVHHAAAGEASTFWTGLGAMRRSVFEACGGFAEHRLEDVELGIRLYEQGARIVLDPRIQGNHLKRWGLWTMLRTDLLKRGAPWIGLLIDHPSVPTATLNLGWRHRLSALACLALLAAVLLLNLWVGLVALLCLLRLNLSFYRLLARRAGIVCACAGALLHCLHYLVAALAVPFGVVLYVLRSNQGSDSSSTSGGAEGRIRAILAPAGIRHSRSFNISSGK